MKLIPLGISIALLSGIAWETGARPRPEDAAPFHRQVRDFFESFPYRIGAWVGTDNATTPSAQQILRPNVVLSRTYRNAETGRTATLLFVQCRDSRDMSGHYPPVCYPAHGWVPGHERTDTTVRLGDTTITSSRFDFERNGFNRRAKVVIWQFFVLPGRGYATSMEAVRDAGADYPMRSFGAAQVQVVMDAGLSPADEAMVASQLLEPLGPVLSGIVRATPGTSFERRGATP